MIPVKDNIPRERFPLVTVSVIATAVLAYALSSRHAGGLPLLLDLLFLWLLGPSVEGSLGRARFGALSTAGALLGLAARTVASASSPSPVAWGACGVTVAVLGGYLLHHPRGRVLTLVPAPFFTTLVEVPAMLLIGLWLVLQVCMGVAGLG
jgi:membrane associated rhomboid family serine protease